MADYLVELAYIENHHKVFETSAGRGAILKAIRRANQECRIWWCEIDKSNRKELSELGINAWWFNDDFLAVDPSKISEHDLFDRVIMNPPFSMNGAGSQTDIDHVTHALRFIRNDGVLVSIMSPAINFRTNRKTLEFKELIKRYLYKIIEIPPGSFKESGTMINAVIVKITKRSA